MKSLLKSAVIAATLLSTSVAHAGGPVIIEEGNNEVITEAPARVGILPILGALVLICLVACGGGSDDPEEEVIVKKL